MARCTEEPAHHARQHGNCGIRWRRCIPERFLNLSVISAIVCRWLVKRTQGISILHHRGQLEEGMIFLDIDDKNRRDQQIALTTIPYLSRLLSPEATLHLDLSWGMSA